jgi:hypothetical protein
VLVSENGVYLLVLELQMKLDSKDTAPRYFREVAGRGADLCTCVLLQRFKNRNGPRAVLFVDTAVFNRSGTRPVLFVNIVDRAVRWGTAERSPVYVGPKLLSSPPDCDALF